MTQTGVLLPGIINIHRLIGVITAFTAEEVALSDTGNLPSNLVGITLASSATLAQTIVKHHLLATCRVIEKIGDDRAKFPLADVATPIAISPKYIRVILVKEFNRRRIDVLVVKIPHRYFASDKPPIPRGRVLDQIVWIPDVPQANIHLPIGINDRIRPVVDGIIEAKFKVPLPAGIRPFPRDVALGPQLHGIALCNAGIPQTKSVMMFQEGNHILHARRPRHVGQMLGIKIFSRKELNKIVLPKIRSPGLIVVFLRVIHHAI